MTKTFKLFSILLVLSFNGFTQNSRWIDYYSYLNIKQIIATDNKIFGVSENAFFTDDLNNSEIEKTSSINGLSGTDIAKIVYHQGLKKTFVIHKDGLIEIIDEQKNIVKITDLKLNTFISEDKKTCQDILIKDNLLYLAMGYGISVFDLENDEFNDTYYIGNGSTQVRVYEIKILNNFIYATTQEGLKKADINSVLIDYNNWTTLDANIKNHLAVFNNHLVASSGTKLYEINGNNAVLKYTANGLIYHLFTYDNLLGSVQSDKIILFDSNFLTSNTITNSQINNDTFTTAEANSSNIFIGTRKNGIIQTDVNGTNFEQIVPNCPLLNSPFGIDVREGNIWVVYGGHSPSFNPSPLRKYGVSHYDGTSWNNIPYQQIQAKSISYVQINPSNIDEVYMSSGHNGLVKITNGSNITKYDDTNSPLEAFVQGSYKSVRVFGLKFDDENNLWTTQTLAQNPVKVIKNDGNWQIYPVQGVINPANATDGIQAIDYDSDGNIWFGTVNKGVLGINRKTGQYTTFEGGIGNMLNIQALAIDKNNTMWIGNSEKLRILSNPKRIFDNPADLSFEPIKIEFEGSVQLLLEGQEISKIVVDGSNNKWIGTIGSGVYYVSDDGKQTIYHFTNSNSPLPSNDIYDIAIDGKSGMVYFATGKGLLGFKGNATDSADDLSDVYAFPNPVNMKKHSFVTIRGLIEGVDVKIVDVEGNLVYETVSKGGSINWDLTAFGRYKVASGVYIALITDEDGEKTQTTKILVIK